MEIDADNLSATELRLGPPGTTSTTTSSSSGDDRRKKPSKRALDGTRTTETSPAVAGGGDDDRDAAAPTAKAQVVGWPPVRAYRKNNTFHFQHQSAASASASAAKKADQQQQGVGGGGGLYVKVSMDGAPYLRKVDLRMYKGYRELRDALDALFVATTKAAGCFSAAAEGGGADDDQDQRRAVAYEDKDGDLMLVGDVPWDMFVSSCKKLRIIKGSI